MAGLPGSPQGDVDILLWAPGRPDESIAIEVKRFKANIDSGPRNRLNKLHEFKKGVRQANALARIGFWTVYLWVFVLVDSRRQNAGNITYAGLGPEFRGEVERAICTQHLNTRVGLIHYEFGQPMDDVPLDVGAHGGHLVRLAETAAQPIEVTAWVDQIAKGNG